MPVQPRPHGALLGGRFCDKVCQCAGKADLSADQQRKEQGSPCAGALHPLSGPCYCLLCAGGYEGGYNQGKTRAKYISKDNGKTWQFEKEIFK